MTAIMAATPQKESMEEWKTFFPKADFTTIEGSTLFIKKLIAVSMSSITYMRGIFPEHAYGERKLGGLRLKVLNENCGVRAVSSFIDLIRGCYDAVEKKYLHQLSIGVCLNPENRNEVVEAYKLEFRYTDDECSITCHNKTKVFSPKLSDPTVKASFLMLKNIYTVSDLLGPLPKCPYITLKLLYYDEVTPSDYEPPGFEPSTDVKFSFPEKCLNVDLGSVDTDHHGFKLLLKSSVRKPSLSQQATEDPLLASSQTSTNGERKKSTSSSVHSNAQNLNSSRISDTSQKIVVKCVCECKSAININTISCGSCERKQHKTCYGMLREEDIPEVFYCVDCNIHNTDGKENTDLVYKYRGKKLKEFCAMRRALTLCSTQENVTRPFIEKSLGCTKVLANVLLERLEFEGFVIGTEERGIYSVDEAHLNEYGWQSYFPVDENKENEDEVYQNSLPNYSPTQENIEIQDDAMNEENYIPETDSKHHENWFTKAKDSEPEGYLSSSALDHQTHSPEYESPAMDDITNVESSIRKVKKLSLSSGPSEGMTTRRSRKRKVSGKDVSMHDSEELFQSQKKPRRRASRK